MGWRRVGSKGRGWCFSGRHRSETSEMSRKCFPDVLKETAMVREAMREQRVPH